MLRAALRRSPRRRRRSLRSFSWDARTPLRLDDVDALLGQDPHPVARIDGQRLDAVRDQAALGIDGIGRALADTEEALVGADEDVAVGVVGQRVGRVIERAEAWEGPAHAVEAAGAAACGDEDLAGLYAGADVAGDVARHAVVLGEDADLTVEEPRGAGAGREPGL